MRLLIKLRCTEDGPYEMQYHYHLQGFIYNLLKGSKYDYLHDKEGYKFFCFSNIFPAKQLEKNDFRTLIISSPDEEFVSYLYEIVQQPWNAEVKIGCMRFKIHSADKLVQNIPDGMPFTLITGTPIIVRIPKEKYQKYQLNPRKEYDYLYWRSEYPIDLFIAHLYANLQKKYQEYSQLHHLDNASSRHDQEDDTIAHQLSMSVFQKFRFKKQISTRISMKGVEQIVIGTVWEFMFEGQDNKNILQFALDAGLGERNSLGFGFMNLLYDK